MHSAVEKFFPFDLFIGSQLLAPSPIERKHSWRTRYKRYVDTFFSQSTFDTVDNKTNMYGGGYGYGRGGGYYNRGFQAPVYPGRGGFGKRTWIVKNEVILISAPVGTTQAETTIALNGSTENAASFTIKNVTITVEAVTTTQQSVFWALVYVPAGTSTGDINAINSGGTVYETPQYTIAAGSFIAGTDPTPLRIFTPLARKLNPGDFLVFTSLGTNADAYQMVGTVKYAIGV